MTGKWSLSSARESEKVAMVPADELRRVDGDGAPVAISQECTAPADRAAARHQIEKAGQNAVGETSPGVGTCLEALSGRQFFILSFARIFVIGSKQIERLPLRAFELIEGDLTRSIYRYREAGATEVYICRMLVASPYSRTPPGIPRKRAKSIFCRPGITTDSSLFVAQRFDRIQSAPL